MVLLAGRGACSSCPPPRRRSPLVCLRRAGRLLLGVPRRVDRAGRPAHRRATLARFVPALPAARRASSASPCWSLEHENISPGADASAGVLKTVYGGLLGLDGPYTYETQVPRTSSSQPSLLVLGIVGLVGRARTSRFRPSSRAPARSRGRPRRAERARAPLRLRHARLLRAARRQELLLLLRRRGDDRLHVRGGLRARRGRPDRRAGVARPRSSTSSSPSAARAPGASPSSRSARPTAALPRARPARRLPRRRGDHPLPTRSR